MWSLCNIISSSAPGPGAPRAAVQHTWPLPAARRRQVGDGSAFTVTPAWPMPVGDTVTAVGDTAERYTVGDTAGTYTAGDTAGTYTAGDNARTYTVGDTVTAGTYTVGDTEGTYTVGDTAGTYTEHCPTRYLSTATALGHVIEHLLLVANCLVLLSW